MPRIKINHGKIPLEVPILHDQLEAEIIAAVDRYSQRFIEAIRQLIQANPAKLRLVHQEELDARYPGQQPGRSNPIQVFRTRWVTNSVYVGLIYDEVLLLELSPGPEGNSIRASFKEKAANSHRRWSATVYSFDKVLCKAEAYQQQLAKINAELQKKKVQPLP
jgi:hypothetical protein